MSSTSALGYLLLPPVEGSSAFHSAECEYAQSWLLYSSSSWSTLLSPFSLFSIWSFSSITHPAPFFFPIHQLLQRQIKIFSSVFQYFWNISPVQTHGEKIFLSNKYLKKNLKIRIGKPVWKFNQNVFGMQLPTDKFSQQTMSASGTNLWSFP